MTALSRRNDRLTGLVRAVLVLEWPLPVPTPVIEKRVSRRYDPDVYRTLWRLERIGEAERITVPDTRCRYWRLGEAPARQT